MTAGSVFKGRGAGSNRGSRYNATRVEAVDDGWDEGSEPQAPPSTQALTDASRSIISYNQSPDIAFDRSINPYRGCEHGCVYCYARPSHAWLGLSPGLDFETRLFFKPDAVARLRAELSRRSYRCAPIALGVNTDAYQPLERQRRVTRGLLQTLLEFRHPVQLITKSANIESDLDLLGELAHLQLVQVAVSVTTLDAKLARRMEPRAAAPQRRLGVIEALSRAGVPTGVFVAPVIPALTDADLESILAAARDAGARFASWTLLRLPLEVRELFHEWLRHHYPERAAHVISVLRDTRNGRDNDSRFGRRMRGEGVFADLLEQRFVLACRRLGFGEPPPLRRDLFAVPGAAEQLALF